MSKARPNPYQAVFIDLDGTYLRRDATVSPRNAEAIQMLAARGVHVVFATGRPIESIRSTVGAVHSSDPAISLSGSMAHASVYGEVLMANTIPFTTVRSILETCRGLDGIANILVDEAEGFFALKRDEEVQEFIGMYGKEPGLFDFDNVPDTPVLSIMVHSHTHRAELYQTLQARYANDVHFTYFKQYPWIEISSFDSNKGQAMKAVCEHLGIALGEAIAIGDGANDLEMIAAAGLGIAMANADDEIKAVADKIAPHHQDDGVAAVLDEIFGLT